MKILVVEDEAVSQKLMQAMLSPSGEVHVASDATSALECFTTQLSSAEPYALVVLDIVLDEQDGIDLLEQIRSVEEEHGRVGEQAAKIVIVSGHGDLDDYMSASRLHCDAFFKKPVDRHRFLGELSRLGLIV